MYAHNLSLVLKHFAVMWVLTVLGFFIGIFLPLYFVIPLSIINISLLIVVVFVRQVLLASPVLYTIPFLSGIMFSWFSLFFIERLGGSFVFSVIIGTAIIFILLALLGLKIPRHVSEWGMYITATFIVVFVFSFIFIIITITSMFAFMFFVICVLLFVLFTVYEFNQLRHHYLREIEIVYMALGLYLSLVNIFIYLLETIWSLKER